jgi:Ras-related GTP-binding protein C/D
MFDYVVFSNSSSYFQDDVSNSSFVQFSIWDFPGDDGIFIYSSVATFFWFALAAPQHCFRFVLGQIDYFDPTFEKDVIFSGCGALIFVIDAQDDYLEASFSLSPHTT